MVGVAYFGSAQQNEFDTYLLDAIAAVVVGGTSLFGGRGGIPATPSSACSCSACSTTASTTSRSTRFLKVLIRGLILLAALIINVYMAAGRPKAAPDRQSCHRSSVERVFGLLNRTYSRC